MWPSFVLRKSSFPSWPCRLFLKRFYPNYDFNWCSSVDNATMSITPSAAFKKRHIWQTLKNSVLQVPTQYKSGEKFFFIKLNTVTTCFEHDIFYNKPKDNVYGLINLRNIPGCCLDRNPSQTSFVEIVWSPKISGKCFLRSHFFAKKHRTLPVYSLYSLQPRTLQNCVTDDFMKVFWNSYTKNFGRNTKKHS